MEDSRMATLKEALDTIKDRKRQFTSRLDELATKEKTVKKQLLNKQILHSQYKALEQELKHILEEKLEVSHIINGIDTASEAVILLSRK